MLDRKLLAQLCLVASC